MPPTVAFSLLMSACDTPVGTTPSWRGIFLDKAIATNPNGSGPQVLRFGPPRIGPWRLSTHILRKTSAFYFLGKKSQVSRPRSHTTVPMGLGGMVDGLMVRRDDRSRKYGRPALAGTKRKRCHDGALSVRRGLTPSLESAAAATEGGTVCGPLPAPAARAARGGRANPWQASSFGSVRNGPTRLRSWLQRLSLGACWGRQVAKPCGIETFYFFDDLLIQLRSSATISPPNPRRGPAT